jgi:hypothetical protein
MSELSLLVPCLDVDDRLHTWETKADGVSCGFPADALDQARGSETSRGGCRSGATN